MNACRWVTRAIGHAPYVTYLPYITHFGCKYVVHGDDITSDSDGNDCYRFVKEAGRFKVVKRSPGISTTDLVGRMLLCTRSHFVKSLENVLAGTEGNGTDEEKKALGESMLERMKLYATDETAKAPGIDVWFSTADAQDKASFRQLLAGTGPRPGQRVVYVDGGFDLFCSGHIEFLRKVQEAEEQLARSEGWYSEQAVNERTGKGKDYGPAFVVVGVHDDEEINRWKGINYPIMNIFERGLCVIQCKVSCAVAPLRRAQVILTACTIVHQRRRVWRAVYADEAVPHEPPMGHARCRVPRADVVHAADVRPVHGRAGDGHLQGDRDARLLRGQRGRDCAAHHGQPRAVRGEAARQGRQGERRGGGEAAGDIGGGAGEEGGGAGGLRAGNEV